MNLKSSLDRKASLVFPGFFMVSCDSENEGIQSPKEQLNLIAISGMDKINERSYLAVYDLKSFEEGNRMAVIEVNSESGVVVHPLLVNDRKHEDGSGSDLESVCHLPGRENEFLIAESGKWNGNTEDFST